MKEFQQDKKRKSNFCIWLMIFIYFRGKLKNSSEKANE